MKAQSTMQTIGMIIVLIIILYVFLGFVFPAMCKAGVTALCGL